MSYVKRLLLRERKAAAERKWRKASAAFWACLRKYRLDPYSGI